MEVRCKLQAQALRVKTTANALKRKVDLAFRQSPHTQWTSENAHMAGNVDQRGAHVPNGAVPPFILIHTSILVRKWDPNAGVRQGGPLGPRLW